MADDTSETSHRGLPPISSNLRQLSGMEPIFGDPCSVTGRDNLQGTIIRGPHDCSPVPLNLVSTSNYRSSVSRPVTCS